MDGLDISPSERVSSEIDFVGICMALNFFNKDDVGLRERYTLGIVSPVSHDMYVPLSKRD